MATDSRKYPSRITASALSPESINGNVQVNTIGINPANSLNTLPTDITDSSTQIADRCSNAKNSSFTPTGRGGIPQGPTKRHGTDRPWNDLRSLTASHSVATPIALSNPIKSIVEASSLQVDESGAIVLVAAKPLGTRIGRPSTATTCGMGRLAGF